MARTKSATKGSLVHHHFLLSRRVNMVNSKSCCVYCCTSRSDDKGRELSFYRLPSNKSLRSKWLHAMRTKTVRVNSNTRVCSKHFPGGRRTRQDEVPSVFARSVASGKSKRKPPAERQPLPAKKKAKPRSSLGSALLQATADSDGPDCVGKQFSAEP